MSPPLHHVLGKALTKDLLLDLEDRLRAEAVKAFEMVRDRSGLERRRARSLEGQARFRMMEQGYEEVCQLHGGRLLDGGVITTKQLQVFQPFMRFDAGTRGVILGLATMPDPKALPIKNKSRLAGVQLNYDLSPRLDLDGTGPKVGDIFALLLVSRHKEKAGIIDEIAVGVIDSEYKTFLFYEPLDRFLAGHGDAAPAHAPRPAHPETQSPAPSVRLKRGIKPYVPPESPQREEENSK